MKSTGEGRHDDESGAAPSAYIAPTATEERKLKIYSTRKIIFISTTCGIASAVAVIFVFFVFLSETEFFNSSSCQIISAFQVCYVSSGAAWSDASYLQTISGFYNSIITILIAALAVVAALGAYTIRASSRHQIEQELPEKVEDFFDRERGKKIVDRRASKAVNGVLNTLPLPGSGELREAFNSLEERIDNLELQLEDLQEE